MGGVADERTGLAAGLFMECGTVRDSNSLALSLV